MFDHSIELNKKDESKNKKKRNHNNRSNRNNGDRNKNRSSRRYVYFLGVDDEFDCSVLFQLVCSYLFLAETSENGARRTLNQRVE